MPEKFSLTAELNLAIDTKAEITKLKNAVKSSNIDLPASIDISSIQKEVEKIQNTIKKDPLRIRARISSGDIKKILTEANSVRNSFEKRPIIGSVGFNIPKLQSDVKTVLKEVRSVRDSLIGQKLSATVGFNIPILQDSVKKILAESRNVKTSLQQPIIGKVFLDIERFRQDIKVVLSEATLLRTSLAKPILGTVLLDIPGFQSGIKTVLSEARGLRTSLQKPLSLDVNVNNINQLQNISSIIGSLQSKNITLGLSFKKTNLDKFNNLKAVLDQLNISLNSLNVGNLNRLSSVVNNLAKDFSTLGRAANKKFTFDLSIKDAKAAKALSDNLGYVAKAFDKATISSGKFNASLFNVTKNIISLRNALFSIDFNNLSSGAKAINSLSNTNAIKTQQALSSSINESNNSIRELGVQSAITFKRFGAYTLVTAGFFRLTFAIRNALAEFIDFNKELTTIRQVTKQSVETVALLGDEVGRLATTFGVSSTSILNTGQVLAQAGFNATETQEALEALAKTEVAPTFDDIKNTTEGAIAAMAQFNIQTKDLDETLSSINSVAAAFAVESEDITTAIQKAGGSFAAAGGDLNELQAIFTAVRATTRESADTIGTGLRTISTRLQRVRTSEFLKDFGINIRQTSEDVEKLGVNVGDFVGPFEALKRIAEATDQLSGRDPRFAQIAEELGGFRQINKVIPILRNFDKAQQALQVAVGGTDSLTRDAIIAQESYANQLAKTREEFLLLIRTFAEDQSVKNLINDILVLTRTFIRATAILKDLIPLLGVLGTIGTVNIAKQFIPGFTGRLLNKNTGGKVPGVGPDKDSVPAMLTPGEFVLRRKAVREIGVSNLMKLNEGKVQLANKGGLIGYQTGGLVNSTNLAAGAVLIPGILGVLGEFGDQIEKSNDSLRNLNESILAGGLSFLGFSSILKSFQGDIKKPLFNDLKQNISGFRQELKKEKQNLAKNTQTANISEFEFRKASRNTTGFPGVPSLLQKHVVPGLKAQADTDQQLVQDNQARIDAIKKNIEEEKRSIRTKAKFSNVLTGVTAGLGALAISVQGIADEIANIEIKELREGRGDQGRAQAAFLTGRAASGASQGAIAGGILGTGALGAKLGAAAGVPGIVAGGVIGAAAGAVVSLVTGANQFQKIIDSIEISRESINLSNILSELENNRTSTLTAAPDIVSILNTFKNTLQSSSDTGLRSDIFSSIADNSIKIKDFVDSLAASSNNIDQFNQRLDAGSQRFISSILKIPFDEFIEKIEKTIKTTQEKAEVDRNAIIAIQDFDSRVRATLSFSSAFELATLRVNTFAKNLEDFSNFQTGTVERKNLITPALSNFGEVDLSTFISPIQAFTNQFGKAGQIIGNDIDDISKAINKLPEILLDLRAQAPLAEEGDLQSRLDEALNKAEIGSNVSNLISSRFDELLGEDFKDSNFFKSLEKDFPKAFQDLISGLDQIPKAISDAYEKANTGLNEFSANLSKLRDIDKRILEGQNKVFDIRSSRVQARETFSGRDLSANLVNIATERQRLNTGGRNVGQLERAILSGRSNIANLDAQIQGTEDLGTQTALRISAEQQRKSVDEATRSLQYLAESTDRLSSLQNQLNKEQSKRETKRKFALDFAFGDPSERIRLGRVSSAAQTAAATGSIDSVPFNLRQDVRSFLEQFSDQIIGSSGLTGREVLNKLIGNTVGIPTQFSGSEKPSSLEDSLQKQIEQQINTQQKAQETLNKILQDDRTKFFTQLTSDIQKFLNDLDRLIASGQSRQINQEISQLNTQKNIAVGNRDNLSNIQNRFGPNALGNFKDIIRINTKLNDLRRDDFGEVASGARSKIISSFDRSTRSQLGQHSINEQDFNKVVDTILSPLSESGRNKVLGELNQQNLGKTLSGDTVTVDPNKALNALFNILENFDKESDKKVLDTLSDRNRVVTNVGGEENFNNILKNSEEISRLAKDIPPNATFEKLNKEIERLTGRIDALRESLPGARPSQTTRPVQPTQTRQTQPAQLIQSQPSQQATQPNISDLVSRMGQLEQTISSLSFAGLQPTDINKIFHIDRIDERFSKFDTGSITDNFEQQLSIGDPANIIDFNKFVGDQIGKLDPKIGDKVFQQFFNQFPPSQGQPSERLTLITLSDILKNINVQPSDALASERSSLIQQLGGQDQFNSIAKNSEAITETLKRLPDATTLEDLNKELEKLTNTINSLQPKRVGFNSGGLVGGVGRSDTVPAMLTPGEFVLNKAAVQKVGVDTLRRTNSGSRKFQDGGLVSSSNIGFDSEIVNRFNNTVSQLNIQIQRIKEVFATIPTEITMTGTHNLNVNINGAQVFQSLQPEFRNLVLQEIKFGINRLLKNKFPEVGTFDG